MRGYTESIRSSAGHGLRVSCANYDLILWQDGLLYGACALWGRSFTSFCPAYLLADHKWQLTVMGMKSEEEAVALQAIEFWTSVAEEETNLESDYLDAQEVRNDGFSPWV